MPIRRLEISHAWGTFALHDLDSGDRIDPGDLPMPDSVAERLDAWSARWDTTFDVDRPDVPKVDTWVVEELAKEGARLWRATLAVLPPHEYEVTYQHEDVRYRSPDELPDAWRLA